jgi:Zn-dependent protease with chaperone function
MRRAFLSLTLLALSTSAHAQFPGADRVIRGAMLVSDLNIGPEEERAIGEKVSEHIRQRYGVLQDSAVHKYVALVGTALAQRSTMPKLAWQFIVLDTDGVNAFAAPGGFIHITRGALALVQNEAELAGVLGHEIIHVTQQHTVKAIKKSKLSDLGVEAGTANAPGGGLSQLAVQQLADQVTDMVLTGFGRADELESDQQGVVLANTVGYSPGALGAFLTRLVERNKGTTEKRGLFASHPQMKERLDRLSATILAKKLAATAVLDARYKSFISFPPKPQSEIAVVEPGAAGLTGGGSGEKTESKPAASDSKESGAAQADKGTTEAPKKSGDEQAKKSDDEKSKTEGGEQAKKSEEQPKKSGMFGIGKKLFSGGGEKKSAQVTGSGAGRALDPERDAKGGPNPALVAVNVDVAELEAFKKEGALM